MFGIKRDFTHLLHAIQSVPLPAEVREKQKLLGQRMHVPSELCIPAEHCVEIEHRANSFLRAPSVRILDAKIVMDDFVPHFIEEN